MDSRVTYRITLGRRPGALLRCLLPVGVIFPLLPLFVWPFSSGWAFPRLLPEVINLRAWVYLFSPASRLGSALFNSSLIAVIVTGLCAALGVPAARTLARRTFPGKGALELFLLMPLLVPPLVVSMGIHVTFLRLRLADTLPGVILVHLLPTLPYMIVVLKGVFASLDEDLEQQAASLGAPPAQVFFRITLPSILPGLAAGSLFVFLVSWSQYAITLLIGGGRVLTVPMLLFAFAGAGDHGVTAALSIVFVMPAIGILLLTAGHLSRRASILGAFGRL
ncbi:MAG: ABC transporter permease [Spirochaetota bacterium]